MLDFINKLKELPIKDITIGTWFNIIMIVLVIKLIQDLKIMEVVIGS